MVVAAKSKDGILKNAKEKMVRMQLFVCVCVSVSTNLVLLST